MVPSKLLTLEGRKFDPFFFFFQAEDGIRDLYVTGVQTCALPISRDSSAGPGDPDDPPRTTTTAQPGDKPRGWRTTPRTRAVGTAQPNHGRHVLGSRAPATTRRERQIGRASCREKSGDIGADGTSR